MPERIPRRTYKWILGFFFGFIFFQGLLLSPGAVFGQVGEGTVSDVTPVNSTVGAPKDTTQEAKGGAATDQAKKPTEEGCSWTGFFTSPISCVIQSLLIGLRDAAGWLANGAANLLVWIVNPENITGPNGMLNKASVYNLWKFIRDFFNLFFILILLVSAFATIFQVESFSIRKIFLNILFAALIINFSFPITRFLIDLTNVPMYYFLNVTVEGTQSGALKITNSLLGASGVSANFVSNPVFSQLIMQVIFTFIFAISLLILAVMLLIRVIALVLLLIFSPLGFAASLLPGMHSLGQQWWSKFWQYALFGPAAALMLMISVRFMNEIAIDGTFGTMVATSSQMSASSLASSAIAQITFFTIPIILIWTAIGMANSGSFAGAGLIVGKGQDFAKWAGKKVGNGTLKVTGYTGAKKRLEAYSKERGKRADAKFAATNIGTRWGQKMNAALDKVSALRKGRLETSKARLARGAAMERDKHRVTEAQKGHLTEKLTDKDLVELHRRNAAGQVRTNDREALHAATTQEIAKRKLSKVTMDDGTTHEITQAAISADLQRVKKNFGQIAGVKNDVTEDAQKEVAKAYGEAAFRDASGKLDEDGFREAIREGTVDASKVSSVAVTRNFARLMAMEGKLNQQTIKTLKDNNPNVNMKEVIGGALEDLNTAKTAAMSVGPLPPAIHKEFEKTRTELNKDYVYANGSFHAGADEEDVKNVMKKSDHETFLKMAEDNKSEFENNVVKLVAHGGPSKAVSILAKLAEDGKDISVAVEKINQARAAAGPGFVGPSTPDALAEANASERAYKLMEKDYRFKGYTEVRTATPQNNAASRHVSQAGRRGGPSADDMELETPEQEQERMNRA